MFNLNFVRDTAQSAAKDAGLSGDSAREFVTAAEAEYKEAGRKLFILLAQLRQKRAA